MFRPYRAENGRILVDGGLVNPVPVTLCRALGADLVIAVNLNAEIVGKHLRNSRNASAEFQEDGVVEEKNEIEKPPAPVEGDPIRTIESDFLRRLTQLFADEDGGASNTGAEKNMPMPGLMDVIASSINIMQDRVTRSRMAGDPADLVLTPRLSHLGLMEFHRAAEAIAAGEQTVE